jgi:hypothetical protein
MNFPFQKVFSGDTRRESKGIIYTTRISLFREEIARFSVTITELPGKIGVSDVTLMRENTQKVRQSFAIRCSVTVARQDSKRRRQDERLILTWLEGIPSVFLQVEPDVWTQPITR